ncbi:pseudouridine synthase [Pseudomonas typographi]|uniref:Pseudouridine synthase n=1 Tax=Pseudomonas typographi TaxID=2715964 RepID=A0ABR7YWB6_9PSED|nr:16S rRNA pseudouridine(516) synthase [Pseudomonas typographi]MBD1585588.1 16S rRNA pseudouridine(516) synthase [Pseudomonas typographi]MBD1597498.1 16S rRNA pseudouridine(516) synthase [Pseudomonas typographi]
MRLDRLLALHGPFNRREARLAVATGQVQVAGHVVRNAEQAVSAFERVEVRGQVLQNGKPARYYMLHKPTGCASATTDPRHRTVLDLLAVPDKHELHLAGRLDYNTTGLLLLTNDGQWSRRLTQPGSKLAKRYRVYTEAPITPHYEQVFARGLYFAYENLTTQPAHLTLLGSHHAELCLVEGRYHQVKRMFGHLRNRVVGLHRLSMGPLQLDPALGPGHYRALTAEEIKLI